MSGDVEKGVRHGLAVGGLSAVFGGIAGVATYCLLWKSHVDVQEAEIVALSVAALANGTILGASWHNIHKLAQYALEDGDIQLQRHTHPAAYMKASMAGALLPALGYAVWRLF